MKYLVLLLLLSTYTANAADLFTFQTKSGKEIRGKLNVQALQSEGIFIRDFDGNVLSLTKVNQIGPSWVGVVEGWEGSQVVVTSYRGATTAIIVYGDKTLEISPATRGDVMRLFTDADLPLIHDIEVVEGFSSLEADDTAYNNLDHDILIAYTTTFRNSYTSDSAAQSAILNAVALANQAYINSEISVTLNPVGIVHTPYVDSGSFSTDLSRFSNGSDGYMDEIPPLGVTLNADLVHLFVSNGDACGIAYVGGVYGVTRRSCIGQHTFTHEIGHNQGALHDRAQYNGGSDTMYNYGYRYCETGGFRTIMAYACSGAGRVNWFSSPTLYYNGRPTGTTRDDNARRIRETAASVAARRPVEPVEPKPVRGNKGKGKKKDHKYD